MRKLGYPVVLLGLVGLAACLAGCAKQSAPLYPTHIEAPDYDPLCQAAHIEGQVVLTATIGADGNVIDVHAVGPPMLVKRAVANLKLWKFEKPNRSRQQTIVYDYAIEGSGLCDLASSSWQRISFDLPQRVEIAVHPVVLCDPAVVSPTKEHR